jgi:uncharacterized protein with HEPN domain
MRSDRQRAQDILSAIADIRADTLGLSYEGFAAKPALVRATLYSISVIGEAAKHLSPAFTEACPAVPWRAVASLRDRVVHEYFRTNVQRIWDVVTDDLDELEQAVLLGLESLP